jgi:hypothetical protein
MANNELLITALSTALKAARASQDEGAIRHLEKDLALAMEQAETEAPAETEALVVEAPTEAPVVEAETEAPVAEVEAPEVEAPAEVEAEASVEQERLQEFLNEARRLHAEASAPVVEEEAPVVEAEERAEAEAPVVEVDAISRKAAPFFRIIGLFSLALFIALIAALCSSGDGGGEALDGGVYHVTCFSGDTVLFNGLSTGEDLKIKKNSLAGKFFLFENNTITAGKTAVPFLTGNCKVVKLDNNTKYYNLVKSHNSKFVLFD